MHVGTHGRRMCCERRRVARAPSRSGCLLALITLALITLALITLITLITLTLITLHAPARTPYLRPWAPTAFDLYSNGVGLV